MLIGQFEGVLFITWVAPRENGFTESLFAVDFNMESELVVVFADSAESRLRLYSIVYQNHSERAKLKLRSPSPTRSIRWLALKIW